MIFYSLTGFVIGPHVSIPMVIDTWSRATAWLLHAVRKGKGFSLTGKV